MKLLRKITGLILLIVLLQNFNAVKANTANTKTYNYMSANKTIINSLAGPTFQVFFDLLSPYGAWVEYSNYGYCWVPRLGVNFRPYSTNGHWVYTDEGWTWYSDYNWGWAPFHYGRWVFDDSYGWIWVPGNEWAPAWVVWGHYGGYYGWAPVGPGITISVGYRPPLNYWTFVPERRVAEVNFNRYIVHDRSIVHGNINIIFNSHSYRNVIYDRGPGVDEIERVTHRKYAPVPVREYDHPLPDRDYRYTKKDYKNNKPLPVYRPQIEHNRDFHGAPGKVEKIDNFKRPDNRSNDKGKGNQGSNDKGRGNQGGNDNKGNKDNRRNH